MAAFDMNDPEAVVSPGIHKLDVVLSLQKSSVSAISELTFSALKFDSMHLRVLYSDASTYSYDFQAISAHG